MAFMQSMATMQKDDPEKYNRLKQQLIKEKHDRQEVQKMLDTAKKEAFAAFPSHEIVPAELIEKACSLLQSRAAPLLIQFVSRNFVQARKELGMDIQNDYNIGFPGSSGQGKSSLINALRGVKAHEPGRIMQSQCLLVKTLLFLAACKPTTSKSCMSCTMSFSRQAVTETFAFKVH